MNEQIDYSYYKNRAYTYAIKIGFSSIDAEDISNEVVCEILANNNRRLAPIRYLVIDAVRKTKANSRTIKGRAELSYKKISFEQDYMQQQDNTLSKIEFDYLESNKDYCESRIDQQLLDESCKQLGEFTKRNGVTDSRNSQLKTEHLNEIARNYLFKHYQEYGIESEIEIDWILI